MKEFPLSDKKFQKLIWITIVLLVLFFAYMDFKGFWGIVEPLGGWPGENYSLISHSYISFFWTWANAMIIGIALMFYYFRKDISESLAIIVGTHLLILGGLEDLFYYILHGGKVMLDFAWLQANTHVGWVATIIGTNLNWATLILQIIVFGLIAYFVINWLKKQKNLFGLKI